MSRSPSWLPSLAKSYRVVLSLRKVKTCVIYVCVVRLIFSQCLLRVTGIMYISFTTDNAVIVVN